MHPIIFPKENTKQTESVIEYIINTCKSHKEENRALAFAFIITDLHNPHLNKILKDEDYMADLHHLSGRNLTIFFIDDRFAKDKLESAKESKSVRFEFGMQSIHNSMNMTHQDIARQLINDEVLQTPSILFFQIAGDSVKDYFITNLFENKVEDGFLELKQIITKANDSFSEVTEENRRNSDELFRLLKNAVEGADAWKTAKRNFKSIMKIKDFLTFWRL